MMMGDIEDQMVAESQARYAAGHDSMEDVIAVFKKDVDMTLVRESLKLTPEQRLDKFNAVMGFVAMARNSTLPTAM